MPRSFFLWIRYALVCLSVYLTLGASALGQVVITGKYTHPRFASVQHESHVADQGATAVSGNPLAVAVSKATEDNKATGELDVPHIHMSGINVFAARENPRAEPSQFRTWETAPAGWYRLTGGTGRYTLLFGTPGHYARPRIVTNIFLRDNEELKWDTQPLFMYAQFDDRDYDTKRASHYWQKFIANGTGMTSVGFKLAHDGVDGVGSGSQTVLVSIHRRGNGPPDSWPQIGPAIPAVEVDCGGPKSYSYSVGWNTGEVVTEPGETYAVQLRAEQPGGTFQTHWANDGNPATDCYREGEQGKTGWQGKDLWLAVGGDGDGLVIPYNKRVHKQFGELTNCLPKWSQSYVAQGKSLAAVQLYAAVSGAQPPLSRQRVIVRIRESAPDGKIVGVERVAIGNGNYTGDASWGVFGTVYSPGEVPLVPGKKYVIEWESLESGHTLDGFVNIKGEVSNGKPGFNPYRKHPLDQYDQGTAYLDGKDMQYDLDAQIVEYTEPIIGATHIDNNNLLINGDFEAINRADGILIGGPTVDFTPPKKQVPITWQEFKLAPDTELSITAIPSHHDFVARVQAPAKSLADPTHAPPLDGGWVQQVTGLNPHDTYRVEGDVRCTWPLDDARQCLIGIDPTGQMDNPRADTIQWTKLPEFHGVFSRHAGEPIRPQADKLSVWLRAKTTKHDKVAPFVAEFDNLHLWRVRTELLESAGTK
ncbi:MAG: hypothetical protein SFX18_16305 [Pirellulales bacterium]|nr:hypothetical protein [Pirellulales bacterium]